MSEVPHDSTDAKNSQEGSQWPARIIHGTCLATIITLCWIDACKEKPLPVKDKRPEDPVLVKKGEAEKTLNVP